MSVHGGKAVFFTVLLILFTVQPVTVNAQLAEAAGALLGGAAIIVGGPIALGAMGFGAAGIGAGSLAAKAMSVAYASGKGVAVISALQSAGAAGIGAGTVAAGAALGAGAGHATKHLSDDDE